jgi:steroid 5-alpha reductase family enzyme
VEATGFQLMKRTDRTAVIVFPILILIGLLVAIAGSQGGCQVAGIPVFALLVGLTFLIQWLVFIPAYVWQSEKFFDLTGSLTYIIVCTLALILSSGVDGRAILVWGLVVIWAVRLGTFLFRRIMKAGKDDRFDEIKPSFIRFLNVWTMQGLWVTLTMAAALVTITTASRKALDLFALIGCLVWVTGFTIEAVADEQKSRFNSDPNNKGMFIRSCLWSCSRHPNYFGEIVLWIGVLLIALPVLQGWQWVVIISPIFVTLLLTHISGVPLLEKKADHKWSGQADYEAYKKRTPVLIPRYRNCRKKV